MNKKAYLIILLVLVLATGFIDVAIPIAVALLAFLGWLSKPLADCTDDELLYFLLTGIFKSKKMKEEAKIRRMYEQLRSGNRALVGQLKKQLEKTNVVAKKEKEGK